MPGALTTVGCAGGAGGPGTRTAKVEPGPWPGGTCTMKGCPFGAVTCSVPPGGNPSGTVIIMVPSGAAIIDALPLDRALLKSAIEAPSVLAGILLLDVVAAEICLLECLARVAPKREP